MAAIAAAYNAVINEGVSVPNPIFTNIGKLYSNMHFIDVVKALIDISGGILATLPSEEDFLGEEKDIILKYLRGNMDGYSRSKILRLAKELAASSFTGYLLTLMIHAEGSIEASKIELFRSYDYNEATETVRKILQ